MFLCVKGGVGGPAGTTLVNNGSFLPPEHLTPGLNTHAEPERKHSHTRLHTTCTHSLAKSSGVSCGGSAFTCLRRTCACTFCVCGWGGAKEAKPGETSEETKFLLLYLLLPLNSGLITHTWEIRFLSTQKEQMMSDSSTSPEYKTTKLIF